MKFAKVLFFVCVIGICAAAGLERTVSKVESEYMAATKAAKAEVGYKEMMQSTNAMDTAAFGTNHKVNLSDTTDNVDALMDMNLIKTDGFNSGIPFYFSNAASVASKSVMKSMIKLNANTYYVPFNTISNNCKLIPTMDPSDKLKIVCNLANKTGIKVFTIIFSDFFGGDMMKSMIVNHINQVLDSKQTARRSHIQNAFSNVSAGIFEAAQINSKIAAIKKSDADYKKAKEDSIEKLKKQIAEFTAAKIALEAQKTTLSQQVQVVQTKITDTYTIKTKKIAYKLSLEATIKTLKEQISPAEALKKLNDNINASMTKLKYWLQGSVYHRVISETEMTGLVGLALNDAQFDGKVNDYFFPQ